MEVKKWRVEFQSSVITNGPYFGTYGAEVCDGRRDVRYHEDSVPRMPIVLFYAALLSAYRSARLSKSLS